MRGLTELVSTTGGPTLYFDGAFNFFEDHHGHLRPIHDVEIRGEDGKFHKIEPRAGSLHKSEGRDDMQKSYTNWRSRNRGRVRTEPVPWAGDGIDGRPGEGGEVSDGAPPSDLEIEILHLQAILDTGIDADMDYGALRSHLSGLKRKQIMRDIHSSPRFTLPGKK